MAKEGQIGNRGLLKSVADALEMEGINRFPAVLNRDQVNVVVCLDPPWSAYETWMSVGTTIAIAALASVKWVVVGNESGAAIFDPFRQLDNASKEFVILGYRAVIRYDAGGAAADAGQINVFQNDRQQVPGGPVAFHTRFEAGFVDATRLFYGYYYPTQMVYPQASAGGFNRPAGLQGAPIWVPAGTTFGISMSKLGGAVWPANTTIDVSAFGIKCPIGMRPPGL